MCTIEQLNNRLEIVKNIVERYEVKVSLNSVKNNTAIYSEISEAIIVGLIKERKNTNGSVEIVDDVIQFVEYK